MIDKRIPVVQEKLNDLYGSLFKISPIFNDARGIKTDGVFGPKTKAALTIWLQLQLCEMGYGVEVDGVFGPKTKAALVESKLSVDCKSTGDLVLLTKYILTCVGYSPDSADRLSQTSPRLSTVWVVMLLKYKEDNSLNNQPQADADFFIHVLS